MDQEKKHKGYVKLWRSLEDNHLWLSEPFTRGQAWVDLFMLANHKESTLFIRGNRIDVKRGVVCRSEKFLALRWQWSRNKVRRYLKLLETEQQIEQQKTASIKLIKLPKYEDFQGNDTTDETTERQQKDIRKTSEGTLTKNVRTIKNVKNEKKRVSFETFWEAYPKKRNKGGAEKAFKKIVAADYLMLIPKIEELKNTADWMKDGGAFIPYPATWLNAKGWMDEVDIDMPKDDAFYINALNDVGQHKFIAKYGEELFIKYAVHYVPKQ